jgi:hypothetical protein
MTDQERFTQTMARMMNKDTESNWWCEKCNCIVNPYGVTYNETHEVCGYPVIWKDSWSSITPEGELTPEVRKWWEKELPDAYDLYCADVYEQGYGRDLQAKYQYIELVRATLDWRNLWGWMKENTDSWLYRKCTTCNGSGLWYRGGDKEFCISCNGTGRVARWDVEKWLECKTKEVGA